MSGQTPPGRLPPSPAPAGMPQPTPMRGEIPPMPDDVDFFVHVDADGVRHERWRAGEGVFRGQSRPWKHVRDVLLGFGAVLVLLLAGVGLISLVQRAAFLLCR